MALITDIPAARPALFLFALFAAAEDFRTRTVPLWLFQGAGVLLLLWHLFRALRDGPGILLSLWAGPLAGLVPGLLLLLASRLNRAAEPACFYSTISDRIFCKKDFTPAFFSGPAGRSCRVGRRRESRQRVPGGGIEERLIRAFSYS